MIRTFFQRAYTYFSEDITNIPFLTNNRNNSCSIHASLCVYAVLRYSLGVFPVCALKKRTKC